MALQLPTDFEEYTRQLLGTKLFNAYVKALEEEPETSIRLNPFKSAHERYTVADVDSKVPWCPYGYYLKRRPNFTFDPLLHSGLYYVQEASSMFIYYAVKEILSQMNEGEQKPLTVLDLCAAPGGKTTCLMSALPEGSVVYSNEPIRSRANILSENIAKFGCPDIKVTNCYAHDYAGSGMKFDIILTDVPCSGEGMFRKDPGAISDWSTQKVSQCAELQRKIVSDIWPCLKSGGYLIYSTCTFNAHENEENIEWIAKNLGASHVDLHVEADIWGIITHESADYKHSFRFPFYRFMPGKTRGEGLFVSVCRKAEETTSKCDVRGERNENSFSDRNTNKKKNRKREEITNIKQYSRTSNLLSHNLVNEVAEATCDISYPQAVSYLRGEALVLPADTPRGIVQVTFIGEPLGVVKNIGNRANNLYPKEWRIKSTHIPDYEPILKKI